MWDGSKPPLHPLGRHLKAYGSLVRGLQELLRVRLYRVKVFTRGNNFKRLASCQNSLESTDQFHELNATQVREDNRKEH